MQKSRCRSLSISSLMLLSVVLIRGEAVALDLSDMTAIYHESFAAEAGLPTTPEVDSDPMGTL